MGSLVVDKIAASPMRHWRSTERLLHFRLVLPAALGVFSALCATRDLRLGLGIVAAASQAEQQHGQHQQHD